MEKISEKSEVQSTSFFNGNQHKSFKKSSIFFYLFDFIKLSRAKKKLFKVLNFFMI